MMSTGSSYIPVRYEGVQKVKLIALTAGTIIRFYFPLHLSPLKNLNIIASSGKKMVAMNYK